MADDWKEGWTSERVNEFTRRRLRPLPLDMYPFPENWGTDRVLRHGLSEILENQRIIMADLTALKAAAAKLSADVALLLADTTSQADVDAVTAELTSADASIVAVLPPPAPAA